MYSGIHNFSEIGKLNKVLLHRPGEELESLTPATLERLLFDDIPYLKVAQEEHDRFAEVLRINDDEAGKTNLSLADVKGEVLVVSQFTLFANCRKGRRPSFVEAAPPAQANELYEYFIELVRADVGRVQTGRFGADMQVELVNDGPFTIVLDTDEL